MSLIKNENIPSNKELIHALNSVEKGFNFFKSKITKRQMHTDGVNVYIDIHNNYIGFRWRCSVNGHSKVVYENTLPGYETYIYNY
jgi:hypothetical protein